MWSREINLSGFSSLHFVQGTNIVVLLWYFHAPFSVVAAILGGRPSKEILVSAFIAALLAPIWWSAWRNVSVLSYFRQPWSAAIFAYGAVLSLSLTALIFAEVSGRSLIEADTNGVIAFGVPGICCAISFLVLLLLRRRRIPIIHTPLEDIVAEISVQQKPAVETDPQRRQSAIFLVLVACAIALGIQFIPASIMKSAGIVAAFWIPLIPPLILLKARALNVPTFQELTSGDSRPPVLFLRSFKDDERVTIWNASDAVFDYSYEARLESHFSRYGPFIAISAPKGDQPLFGAARTPVAGDAWQERIKQWMQQSSMVVMVAGLTNWVDWELRTLADQGLGPKLIICFPPYRLGGNKTAERFSRVVEALKETAWGPALRECDKPHQLKAMVLHAGGYVTFMKSPSRDRTTHHLAAVVAHCLLDVSEVPSVPPEPTPADRASLLRHWGFIAAPLCLLAVTLLYFAIEDHGRLYRSNGSNSGRVFYKGDVRDAEAKRLESVLRQIQYFGEIEPRDAYLHRDKRGLVIGFVVKTKISDPAVAQAFRNVAIATLEKMSLPRPKVIRFYDLNLQFVEEVPVTP